MTAIDRVLAAFRDAARPVTVRGIIASTNLPAKQVYGSITKLRARKVVVAQCVKEAHGREKLYWLSAGGKPGPALSDVGPPVKNVPIVEMAAMRVRPHAGNPFAGLMS